MKLHFNERDLDLAANDVILALDGHISRDEAKLAAKAVLEGVGHIYRPHKDVPKRPPIFKFQGGEPLIGLRRKRSKPCPFGPKTGSSTRPIGEG